MKELTTRMKRRIKHQVDKEKPTIRIGKGQVSQQILKEIGKQLEKKEIVKIKILKSALQGDKTKRIAQQIAEQTEASLVEVRGHTFMLYKSSKK